MSSNISFATPVWHINHKQLSQEGQRMRKREKKKTSRRAKTTATKKKETSPRLLRWREEDSICRQFAAMTLTMTMTHSKKSHICRMKAWPYRQTLSRSLFGAHVPAAQQIVGKTVASKSRRRCLSMYFVDVNSCLYLWKVAQAALIRLLISIVSCW